MRLEIDAPVNGRIHKATVTVMGDDGAVLTSDRANLTEMRERKKLAERLAKRVGKDAAELLEKLEAAWSATMNERRQRAAEATPQAAEPGLQNEAVILDAFPAEIRRPLCLVEGRGHAAAWLPSRPRTGCGAGPASSASSRGRDQPPPTPSAEWPRW
jgi:hypothetical protein